MSAGWGWVDFSTEDKNRIASIMALLKDQGVLDELGISVLRDGISNALFPGLSTIQTRAKYFLFTPVIVRKYYQDQQGLSLPEYFSKTESEFIQQTVIGSPNEDGIFGSTLTDAKDLQRKPSAIYWNGQRTLGLINLKQRNMFLSQYLRHNTIEIHPSAKATEDDTDFGMDNTSGIFLPKTIIKNFNPGDIHLTVEEAVFLLQTFTTSLAKENSHSLLYSLCTDKKLVELLVNNDFVGFHGFYDSFKSLPKYKNTELYPLMSLAYYFSEIIYGAHLLYNVLIQKKIALDPTKYDEEWTNWKIETKLILDKLDLELLKTLVGNDPHNSVQFLEQWISYLRNNDQTSLENLVIEQEFKCKGERARLKKPSMPAIEGQNWIGMRRMNYRIYQARVIFNDIYQGGAYAKSR